MALLTLPVDEIPTRGEPVVIAAVLHGLKCPGSTIPDRPTILVGILRSDRYRFRILLDLDTRFDALELSGLFGGPRLQ
jgi:hypothetical protein